MPELPAPSSTPTKCEVNLNLRLSDVPGPTGHALAHTPWKIAIGERPHGLALIRDKDILAQGETDADGHIKFAGDESSRVSEALCHASRPVWLVYPGQSVRITYSTINPNWSDNELLFHLLKSQGYFRDVSAYQEGIYSTAAGMEELLLAMKAYDANSVAQLIQALRVKEK